MAKLCHVALVLQIFLNTGVQIPKTNPKTMTKTISEGVWSSRVWFILFCIPSITSRRGLVFRALRNPCAHAHRLLAALDLLPNCGKRPDQCGLTTLVSIRLGAFGYIVDSSYYQVCSNKKGKLLKMVENGLKHPKPELSGEKIMSLKDLVGSFYTNMEMDRTKACQGTRGAKKTKNDVKF